MSEQRNEWLEPELQTTGRSVARLSRPKAPAGLLARTLEKAALIKPLRRKILLLRPITHPLARIAAAAMLMSMAMTVPLADLDTVEKVGWRIEHNVVGTKAVDHLEPIMLGVLATISSDGVAQDEVDSMTRFYRIDPRKMKPKPMKARTQPGV